MSQPAGVSMKPESPGEEHGQASTPTKLTPATINPAQLEEAFNSAPLIAYLSSPQGHEVLTRVLTMLENLKKATIDTTLDQEKRKLEFHHSTWRFWMWAQIGLVISAIGTAGLLAWHGKLDAGVATLIGTLVGYVFGKSKT